ncbi:MAG: helix-turn-helix domain-containing protein [Chloroflexota bacterium]|nr:helix-turn-helix domain-containing protein [Chloroflexota bacterium]
MGRTININLTDEQRAELEAGYCHGTIHVFRQRCHMVLLKADQRTSADVADIVGVCPQTVNGLLWRYQQAGIIGLETQPGQGRRAILQVAEDAAAVRLAVTDHRQRIAQARAGQDTVRDTLMEMAAGLHNL